MQDMLRFLWVALREYWITWVTGTGLVGFALWLINLWDKRRAEKGQRTLTMRQNLLVLFCAFWFLATFSAWHDADKNLSLVQRQRQLDTSNLSVCQIDLRAEKTKAEFLDGQLRSQRGTLDGQQATINTCVVALAREAKPEPPRLTVHRWKFPATYRYPNIGLVQFWVVVVVSNKEISPLRGTLKCNVPFRLMDSTLMTRGVAGGGNSEPVSDRAVHLEWIFPPLSQQNPLAIALYTADKENLGECSFVTD